MVYLFNLKIEIWLFTELMKKFILILGLLLCYATIAGTSQTDNVWVVNGKNIPLVSPAKT